MFKKIVCGLSVILSFNAFAAIQYKEVYQLPAWGGNPYTPLAISRVEPKKSSPNPLDAKFIVGIQDREFYNLSPLRNVLSNHGKPLYLFGNWFIYAENPKAACNGTQLILRSSSGEMRAITMKPEKGNIIDQVVDCYMAKRYDKVNRVIYLTNEVVAFDSTIGVFFFNIKKGSFYEEVFNYPGDSRVVFYTTQDGDFLLETVEDGTPIRKYRDGYDPRVGMRALRLDGQRVPGVVLQEELNSISNKRGL